VALCLCVCRRTAFPAHMSQALSITSREDWETLMTHNVHLQTAPEPHDDPTLPTTEGRPLSFSAALVGFVLSTVLTSTVMVLLSQ
jgi:hypothetical protein